MAIKEALWANSADCKHFSMIFLSGIRLSLFIRLFCVLFLLGRGAAFAENALLISEVSVDVTAADANAARTQAMAQAERDGLIDLLDKLAPDQKESLMKSMDVKQIGALVNSTEVLEEKTSSDRYRATLRLTYDAEVINQLIQKKVNAAGSEEDVHTSTLIIPVLQTDEEKEILWEEANTWRRVWERIGLEVTTGGLVVPYGDSLDSTAITAQNAMAAPFSLYLPMIRRYGVHDVAVLQARLKDEGKVLEVVKRTLDRARNDVNLVSYNADPQEDLEALMARAARDVVVQLTKAREEKAAARASQQEQEGLQMAVATFSNMQSWALMRKKMESLPLIRKIQLVAMAPQQIDLMIYYRGNAEGLAQAIGSRGIVVKRASNYWLLAGE